jgi:hypothetical protein
MAEPDAKLGGHDLHQVAFDFVWIGVLGKTEALG